MGLWGRLCLLCAAISGACLLSCGPKAIQKDFQASASGVELFHSQLDSARFDEIYSAAAPELKNTTSEADFVQLLAAVHRKLGRVRSSNQVGFSETWNIHEGTIVRLDYETLYEQGEAKEHFEWRPHGSQALLVAYRIDSQALIVR